MMLAHARLVADCPPGNGQATRLQRLRSQAPLILRPTRAHPPAALQLWDLQAGRSAGVSLVGGAAGPLGGDHLRLDIDVGTGATLIVKAVAATLVLPGPHGKESSSEVNINVAAGGTLVWLPGRQILAENCRHRAATQIDLDPTARLFMREELVLGRHGESPGAVRQRLRVACGGRAVYDQELAVGEGAPGWDGPAVTGGRRALGSVILAEPAASSEGAEGYPLPDVADTALMALGASALLVSSLAADSIQLNRQLDAALAHLAGL
jgi:urease accessory protein